MASVKIKWTDPPDILTNEPAPAIWAGTVVVRKSGSAPLHKWDGTIIVDSTTRDEYSVNPLIDNNIEPNATYYYGIFPYDTKGDYRYTKVVKAFAAEIPAPEITSLSPATTSILVNYSVSNDYTWDHITLVYKKDSAPADKTDGTAVSLSASSSSVDIIELDQNTTYYFKIFAQAQGASGDIESNTASATTVTPAEHYRCLSSINVNGVNRALMQIDDFTQIPSAVKEATTFRDALMYARSNNAPSYVTDFGYDFYNENINTMAAAKVVVAESEYISIWCPSGQYYKDERYDTNGLIINNKVTSAQFTWGFSPFAYEQSSANLNGYRQHRIGIVLEDTYHRGYILVEDYGANWNYGTMTQHNGYRIYALGGVVNGVDYVYETFKNM